MGVIVELRLEHKKLELKIWGTSQAPGLANAKVLRPPPSLPQITETKSVQGKYPRAANC